MGWLLRSRTAAAGSAAHRRSGGRLGTTSRLSGALRHRLAIREARLGLQHGLRARLGAEAHRVAMGLEAADRERREGARSGEGARLLQGKTSGASDQNTGAYRADALC